MNDDYTGNATRLEPTEEDWENCIQALIDEIEAHDWDVAPGFEKQAVHTLWPIVARHVLTAAARAVVSDAAGNRDFNQGLLHAEAVLKALRGDT